MAAALRLKPNSTKSNTDSVSHWESSLSPGCSSAQCQFNLLSVIMTHWHNRHVTVALQQTCHRGATTDAPGRQKHRDPRSSSPQPPAQTGEDDRWQRTLYQSPSTLYSVDRLPVCHIKTSTYEHLSGYHLTIQYVTYTSQLWTIFHFGGVNPVSKDVHSPKYVIGQWS
jgi:hypothetical protein